MGLVTVVAGWACITTALALSIRRSKATAGASHCSPGRDARLHSGSSTPDMLLKQPSSKLSEELSIEMMKGLTNVVSK